MDLKEQMFRNFGGHLGPKSEIIIALWTTPVLKEKEKEEWDATTMMEALLIDPLDAIAARVNLFLDENEEVAIFFIVSCFI